MSHAGNWSESKRALERSRGNQLAAREADDALLAPGWKRGQGGSFWPIMTPAGAILRRAAATGRCETNECERTVRVNFRWWCEHGHGDEPMAALVPSYRCSRVGCRLSFGEEFYPAGRPLIDLTAHARNQVEFQCLACRELGREPVLDFIRMLLEFGTGNGNIPIRRAYAALIVPCPHCQAHRWEVRAFEPRPFYDRQSWEEIDQRRAAARTLVPSPPPKRIF